MAGVYISYPFCGQKCTYCNFASGVLPKALEEPYIDALVTEIKQHEWSWRPETVFLGGGTPSQMDLAGLESIMAAIPGVPWIEATIEGAPGSITPARSRAWRAFGINRVSLGVQSFVTRELARTGRKHSAETVERDLQTLSEAGIDRVNLDLIAGLPGQTRESWAHSLDWVERLATRYDVGHVSVYMLEVDEHSRLGQEILLGGVRYGAPEVPSGELIAEFYQTAVDRLAQIGIARYEISNFARPGLESRHNLKYWKREPYIGFGSDAHSFDGTVRTQNVEAAETYVERIRQGQPACVESSVANEGEERFFVGLRLSEGIQPREDEWRRFGVSLHRFLELGLLERRDATLRLTDQGILFSNEVFQEFVNT